MSCIFGENRDIFFPKLSEELHLVSFSEIAKKYLASIGYQPHLCASEDEARDLIKTLPNERKWPCLFTKSDTTGEKDFEEFYTVNETLDMKRFESVGVIKNQAEFDGVKLDAFMNGIETLKKQGIWNKGAITKLYFGILPNFAHKETGKYLDQRM